MQWSLFLLILMGQCSFFMCHLYEYHFFESHMTWHEARRFCRVKYTDLATVYDMTDVERLRGRAGRHVEAWIGLQSNPGKENRMWHWSLPGVEYSPTEAAWGDGQPNDLIDVQNCVKINNYRWDDRLCSEKKTFVCYSEKKNGKKFHFVNKAMTWPQAQNYCREHHTDLVSGLAQLNDEEFKNEITSQQALWIGLFRDTWRWSDRSDFSFRNWDPHSFQDEDRQKCAMTVSDGSGKWSSDDCDKGKPFFCYEDKVYLVTQSMTWEEALNYCRRNHQSLVSITNLHEERWVQERAKRADTNRVWLGLRYTCVLDLWFWVSDNLVCYENWASGGKHDECDMSAAMARGGQQKWFSQRDNEKFNFICAVNQNLEPPSLTDN